MNRDHEQNGNEEPDWTFEPETIVRAAWRRKGWLLAGLLFGLGASAAVSMVMPRAYQSTAQISILRKNPEAIPDNHPSPMDSIAPPSEVLRSPAIIENAIRSRSLDRLGIFAHVDDDLVVRIRTALTVVPTKVPVGQSNLFRLSYRDGDGEDCQTVLRAVLDSYRALLEEQHQAATGNAIELILREQEKVHKELAKQEADYLAFREDAPLFGKARDGLDLKQERLNSIQAKRSALLLQKVEVEGQLAAVEQAQKQGRGPDTVLVMLAEFSRRGEAAEPGSRPTTGLQEQLQTLLLEERRLLRLHGARHPEVRSVRERIDAARRLLLFPPAAWKAGFSAESGSQPTLEALVRAHLEVLRQRLEELKIAEEMLAATLQKEQDEARRLAAYEIRNETFQSNITLSRQLSEALVKRLNDSSLLKGAGGYHVEVVEPPSSARRVSPNYPVNLAVGAFLGFLAGLLLAVWADGRAERRRDQYLSEAKPPSVRLPDDAPSEPERLPQPGNSSSSEVPTSGLPGVPARLSRSVSHSEHNQRREG
jgi:polysaccharide biosynthesis transport protein